MAVLIFAISILMFLTLINLLSYLKWKETKKMEASIRNNARKVFEDLQVSSFSTGKSKSIMGFQVKATLFIMQDRLIITPGEMTYKLFHTILPVTLENKQGAITQIKNTNWKAILITFRKNTLSLGSANINLTIKTRDKEQQFEIYNEIKDWSN
jgi:hypothetical protein